MGGGSLFKREKYCDYVNALRRVGAKSMVQQINKHGLPRNIPTKVKQEVRLACGFGCVVCGAVPYEYDHFRVAWPDAVSHEADDIILLCDEHHTKKTKGHIDNEWISTAMRVSAMDRPSRFVLPGTNPDFRIRWPANNIEATTHGVIIDKKKVLELEYQESELEPIMISGQFRDLSGNLLCEIVKNEIITKPDGVGDFVCTADRFEFTDRSNRKSLEFTLSNRGLDILQISHMSGGSMVVGNRHGIWVCNGVNTILTKNSTIRDCDYAIQVESRAIRDYSLFDITKSPAFTIDGADISGGQGGISLL